MSDKDEQSEAERDSLECPTDLRKHDVEPPSYERLYGVDVLAGDAESEGLTVKQFAAVNYCLIGMTDGEVAGHVGVTRQTVNRWRNHDPAFRAALARRRRDTWSMLLDRYVTLVWRAMERAEQDMAGYMGPEGSRTARALLGHLTCGSPMLALSMKRAMEGHADPFGLTVEDVTRELTEGESRE